MLASLHAPESLGSLIATGYAMFFGGLLVLGARLGGRGAAARSRPDQRPRPSRLAAAIVVFSTSAKAFQPR
jgi:hypothetical protein